MKEENIKFILLLIALAGTMIGAATKDLACISISSMVGLWLDYSMLNNNSVKKYMTRTERK